jgi:predicted aldo/keto reductase-like oxidoreductase
MSTRCGSRRAFLQTTAVAGGALGLASSSDARATPHPELPSIVLGRTGQRVSRLGMGTSWTVAPSFVQAALFSGVAYIDTSESYENGNSESTVGAVLERTGKRKDVYLVTKNASYRENRDPAMLEQKLVKSLERLKTDYVDAYYLHGLKGEQIPMLFDPAIKAKFEQLRKAGKIRFAGLSCHDARLVEVVEAAAKCGWIDQIMIQYNFRTMPADDLRRAVDAASKANLGLVAMKTQGGAEPFTDEQARKETALTGLLEKGFSVPQAAIKTVLADERFQVIVSEMTNREQLKENSAVLAQPLSDKEARLLEEHRLRTAHLYCQGCGHHCEPSAGGKVAEVLRHLRYHEIYGKRGQARQLYQALPIVDRTFDETDRQRAEAACPHRLPVAQLLRDAERLLS